MDFFRNKFRKLPSQISFLIHHGINSFLFLGLKKIRMGLMLCLFYWFIFHYQCEKHSYKLVHGKKEVSVAMDICDSGIPFG